MKYSKVKFLTFFAIICSVGLAPINDASAATTFVDEFDVFVEAGEPLDLAFNTEGTKMFVMGDGGTLWEYNCAAFDVSTCAVSASDEIGEEANAQGFAFNNNGTKMFVVGYDLDAVFEYNCAAFDVSTCAVVLEGEKDVSTEESVPLDLTFNTDGTKMFVTGTSGDVNEYDCAAFDVSTCAVVVGGKKDVSTEEDTPQDLTFNTDGTKMFVTGNDGDKVYEYACAAFDVSTCSFTDAFSVLSQDADPTGLTFNTDGTKMFVTGANGQDVNEYTLSVGFDLNTAAGSDCYDCTPPVLQSAHVTISSNDYVVATGDEPVHITANVGDKVTILLNVTDDKPVDTIPFAALYTNFEQKPSDMSLYYANNHDNLNKVSTSFYEWNVRADDVAYDYDGTLSWSDNTPTVVTGENTEDNFKFKNSDNAAQHLAMPFTFTINEHMGSKIVAEIYDANANRLQVTLPIILKTAGNDPLDFENMGKQKVLGFFDESVLNVMILKLNGSEDASPLSEFLGIPDESLPAWTLDLATWVADDKIDSANMIVAVEYLINQ